MEDIVLENIKLKTVLKNGDIVKTKKRGEQKWNTNVAFDVRDGELVLDAGINEEYYDSISVGDSVECKVTTDKFEYTMDAVVSSVLDTPIRTMTLDIKEIKKYTNERKDTRHFVHLFALMREKKDEKAVGNGIDPDCSVLCVFVFLGKYHLSGTHCSGRFRNSGCPHPLSAL